MRPRAERQEEQLRRLRHRRQVLVVLGLVLDWRLPVREQEVRHRQHRERPGRVHQQEEHHHRQQAYFLLHLEPEGPQRQVLLEELRGQGRLERLVGALTEGRFSHKSRVSMARQMTVTARAGTTLLLMVTMELV